MAQCDKTGVKKAVKILEAGGVIVFPTDTVYGIGCNPYDETAVREVYRIKHREPGKLFPVLSFSKKLLEKIAVFNDNADKIAEKFWPGNVTLLLKVKDHKLASSLMLEDKVAVRVPANHCILAVLEQCQYIVGTSANISGTKPFTNPEKCYKNMSGFDMFLNGGTITSKGESTIVDVTDGIEFIREGGLTRNEVMKAL